MFVYIFRFHSMALVWLQLFCDVVYPGFIKVDFFLVVVVVVGHIQAEWYNWCQRTVLVTSWKFPDFIYTRTPHTQCVCVCLFRTHLPTSEWLCNCKMIEIEKLSNKFWLHMNDFEAGRCLYVYIFMLLLICYTSNSCTQWKTANETNVDPFYSCYPTF